MKRSRRINLPYIHQTGTASTLRERATISGTRQITAPWPGFLSRVSSIERGFGAFLLGVAVSFKAKKIKK
jgi:hypothetical protein